MRFLRSSIRSIQVVGYIAAAVLELLLKKPEERPDRAEWLHRLCARAIRGLGIEVEVTGEFPERGAVISNHLSYADIVIFAAIRPCVFVSKLEVKDWPVIGWMTVMAGTVFVERGRGGSAARAGKRMSAAFDAGLPVVFFPEGTTSNGSGLLKFHSGLLAQSLAAGAPVTAAYLSYSLPADNGPGVTVANDVCYWDGSMWLHIIRFLGLRGVRAEVRFAASPIAFTNPTDRKLATREARSAVDALRSASEVSTECTISDSTNVHVT